MVWKTPFLGERKLKKKKKIRRARKKENEEERESEVRKRVNRVGS